MVANIITFLRLILFFMIIALLGVHSRLDILLIMAIPFVYVLDTVDGYTARKRNEASKLGGTLDSVIDRIIENTIWIYFAVNGNIPIWVPIFVMARCFIKDSNIHHFLGLSESGWIYHFILRSRVSSVLSCTTQMFSFISLACANHFKYSTTETASLIFVAIALAYYSLYIFYIIFQKITE